MKIVGYGVCGGGEAERYLEGTLDEFSRLCDETIIMGNNLTEAERIAIRRRGFHLVEDSREWGKEQPRMKTDLLKEAAKLKPDWILPLDMDEVFDPGFTRTELLSLVNTNSLGYYFYIVNHWNSPERYWKAAGFWNIRLYKFAPELGLEFLKKNVHCGLAPPYAYQYGRYAPFHVRHYGLMNPEDRKKKVERYRKYDPKSDKVGIGAYYDALAGTGNGEPYSIVELREKVRAEVGRMNQKDKVFNMPSKPQEFVYLRRSTDGHVIDVPKLHLDRYLNQKKQGKPLFELLGDVSVIDGRNLPQAPIVADPFECPICGEPSADADGLEAHKKSAHEVATKADLKCPHCSFDGKTEAGLKRHLKTHV